MIKGGFQGLDISGVDLTAQSPTLPGGYAACQAADGKTVLVLTAAGAVQCSVKKASTNYVLAGITGDGKILSITIGSTDGISVSETVVPSGTESEEYFDEPVIIGTATSSDPYIADYDGIVILRKTASGTSESQPEIKAKIGASHALTAGVLALPIDAPAYYFVSCFVKKGSILYAINLASNTRAEFYPYKPVQS